MRFTKFWVASSAAVGIVAGGMLAASPAMAAQKSCNIPTATPPANFCVTGTLPANSSSHAITICAQGNVISEAFDVNTKVKVGQVRSSGGSPTTPGTLKCTDIGGLFGSYHVRATGLPIGKGFISN